MGELKKHGNAKGVLGGKIFWMKLLGLCNGQELKE